MKALIIVDVQNDFLPGGALPVPEGDKIIPEINRIQEKFDLIVATQDWHPEGHISFASSHKGKKPFDVIQLSYGEQILWPDHCVRGSYGADFSSLLDTKKIEAIFRKGTDVNVDSYSAFYDNNRQKTTGLAGYLRDKGVREVYVCGLATEVCVFYTAKDSLISNFQTWIILSASKGLDDKNIQKAINEIVNLGGNILETI